jgi:endonuclease V-like protein UPF0215 family
MSPAKKAPDTTKMPKLVRYDDLSTLFDDHRSRNAIKRAVKRGDFPEPVRVSPLIVGWREADLVAYYQKLHGVAA